MPIGIPGSPSTGRLNPNPQWPFWVGQPPPAAAAAGPQTFFLTLAAATAGSGTLGPSQVAAIRLAVTTGSVVTIRQAQKLLTVASSAVASRVIAVSRTLTAGTTGSATITAIRTKLLTLAAST